VIMSGQWRSRRQRVPRSRVKSRRSGTDASWESELWDEPTQAAVDQIMACTNALFDMVLRLAEAIDELRDAPDVKGDIDG
jgi:hypothetical protein